MASYWYFGSGERGPYLGSSHRTNTFHWVHRYGGKWGIGEQNTEDYFRVGINSVTERLLVNVD